MSIAQTLAKIHSSRGVYSSKSLINESGNILTELRKYSNFEYLTNFYDQYIQSYDKDITTQINHKKARSKDLFFIGEDVIKSGRPKFFFVFEGSLSATEKLSITVLSHLWMIEDEKLIEKFFGKDRWWRRVSDYYSIKEKLNITSDFAYHSYVTDALRIGNTEQINKDKKTYQLNRELIYAEIILLNPQLVICVGKTAREVVGMKYFDQETKFHSVKFPKYHNDIEVYKELLAIMGKI